jgi:undecaprenyl-diphosphatase
MRVSTGVAGVCAAGFTVTAVELLSDGPLKRLDSHVAGHYFDNLASRGYTLGGFTLRAADLLAHIGKPWIACLVVGGLGLLITLRTRRLGPALAAAVGLGIAGAGTWLFKEFFPHPAIYQNRPGSFPSGHTCVAVVSAGLVIGFLVRSHPRWEAVALVAGAAWGAVMAWGRVALLAHWLSDVVAGWCLGMVALVVALRLVQSSLTLADLSPALRALRRTRS